MQAIRWWNWDIKKIHENYDLLIGDAREFADRFYSPELEIHPRDEIGDSIRELKSRGFKIFSTIADFDAQDPVWTKLVQDFSSANLQNSILVMHSPNSPNQIQTMINFVDKLNANIIVVKSSIDALLETDILITTREFESMLALDALNSKSIDVRYALDDYVFF